MPNTTTVTWPALVAGFPARASDVESKFDFSEYHLWPHGGGNFTDNTYDLGNTTTSQWRCLYTYSINATSTARGLAIGTTTVGNNSSTALEIAGTRALLLPRLSTTQRDALTAAEGHMIYNSTSIQFQMYQNGAWSQMGGGPSIGIITKLVVSVSATATATVLSIGTGVSGRLVSNAWAGTSGTSPTPLVILDSVTSGDIGVAGASAAALAWLTTDAGQTTGTLNYTLTVGRVDIRFKDQLKIYLRSGNAGTTVTSYTIYERSA